MWTHVRTAPNKVVAEMWGELLENASIPTLIKPDEAEAHLGELSKHRIFVPADRVDIAKDVLKDV